MGPGGVFRGQAAARGSRSLPFGAGGGEVRVGGEVGGRRRGRGEVYQPGRRETGGGRATQRPFGGGTRGRPCRGPNAQHPTPKQPNAQRPTPNARRQRALGCTYRDADYTVVKYSIGASKRAIEVPVKWPRRRPNAPGVTLPRTQRPTPNAQATQRPKNEPLRIATPT